MIIYVPVRQTPAYWSSTIWSSHGQLFAGRPNRTNRSPSLQPPPTDRAFCRGTRQHGRRNRRVDRPAAPRRYIRQAIQQVERGVTGRRGAMVPCSPRAQCRWLLHGHLRYDSSRYPAETRLEISAIRLHICARSRLVTGWEESTQLPGIGTFDESTVPEALRTFLYFLHRRGLTPDILVLSLYWGQIASPAIRG